MILQVGDKVTTWMRCDLNAGPGGNQEYEEWGWAAGPCTVVAVRRSPAEHEPHGCPIFSVKVAKPMPPDRGQAYGYYNVCSTRERWRMRHDGIALVLCANTDNVGSAIILPQPSQLDLFGKPAHA